MEEQYDLRVTGSFKIGRSPLCNVILSDTHVSKVHCSLNICSRDAPCSSAGSKFKVLISDLSSNGTWITHKTSGETMKLEKGRPTLLKEGDIILLTRSTVANPDIIAYKYLPSPFPRVIKCNNYKPDESLTQDNADMLHCEERNDRICEEMVQSVENKREEDIPTAEAMDSNKIDVCIDTRSATSTCTGLSNSLACIANSRVHDNTENKGKDVRDEIQKYNLEINDLEAVGNTSTRTKPSPSDPCVSSHLKTTNCTEKVSKKCSHMKRKYKADEQWVRPRKVRFKEQIEEDLEHLTSLTGILVKNDDSHMDTDTDYASSGVTGKKSSTMILKDNRDFENGPQRDCGKVEGVTHPTTSLAMEVPRGSNIPSATGNPSGLSTSAEKCNSSPIESKVNRENYEQTSGFDSSTDDSQCGRCVHCEKWIPRVTISLHEAICEGHSQEPKSQDHVSLSSLPHESGFPEIQSPEKLATSSDENDITIAYDQSEDEIGQQDTDNRDTEREHNETPCAKEHIETQVVQGKCTEPKVSSTSTFTSRESAKSEECTTAKTSSSTEQHKLSLKSIQDETESISAPQNPVSLISSSTEHHELVPGSVQDENEPISVPHNPDTVTLSSTEQHEQALGSIQDENESISAPQNPATLEKEESEERCTFCSALLPVPDLILHVAACSKASAVPCTVAHDPESIHEGCPYCANVFNVLQLVEHVELCKSLSMIRAEEVSLEDCHPSPAAERGSDCETRDEENSSMRDRELCPKCNREFSLLELLNHAAECGRKKRRLVPLSISLRSPQGDVNDHFAASDADDSSERSADSEVKVGTVGDDVVVNSDRSDPNDSKLNDPLCSSDEASDDKSGRNSHRITRRDIEDDGDSDVDRGEYEDDKNDEDDDRCKEEDDRRKEEDDDMFHGDYDHGNSRSDSDNSISCRDDDESEDEEDVDHESDSGDVWHNSSDCDTRGEEDSTMRDRELCPKCNREFSLLELLNHAAECGRKKRRIVPLSIRLRSRQGAVNDHLDASDADDGSERNADSESKDETVGGDVGVKGDREESEENDHVCSSDEASDDKSGRDSHRITRRDIEDDGDSDFGRGEDKDDENDKDDDRCKEEDGRRKEEDDDIIHGDYDHGVSRSDFGNSISCRDDDERKDEENVDHESDSGDVLHNECDDDGNDIIPGGCDYSHSDDVISMCHDDELSSREGHSSDGEHDDAMETSEGSADGDEFEMCPNCRKLFHISRLIKHASNCSSVLSDVKTDETVADDVGADCDRSGPDDSKVNDQVCSSDEASDDKSGRNSHRISRRDIEDDGDSDVNRGEGEDDENEKDDDRRKEEDDGIIHGDHDYGNNHSDYGNGIPCRDNDESKDEESVDHENDSDVVSHNECDDDGDDITHGGYSHLSGDVSSMCHDDELGPLEGHSSDDELSTREGHSSDDEHNDAIETSEEGADGDELEMCPNCRKLFHLSLLIEHASNCSSALSDVKTPLESCTGVSTLGSSATTPVVFSDCSYCGISLPVALMAVHYPKCKNLCAIKRNVKSSEGCSRPGGHIDPAGFPERFDRIDNLSNRVVVNEGNTGESLARASKTAYLENSISSPETKVAGSTGDSREADEIKGSSFEKTASSLNRRKGFSRSEGPSDPARILELFDRIDNLSSRVTVNDEEKEECSARASKTAYLGDSSSSTETKVAGSTDDSGEADEVKEMSFKSTVFSLKSSKGCSRSQGPSDPAGVLELFDRIDNLSSRVSVSDEKKEGCLVSASKTACLGDSSSSRETEVAGSTDDSGEADDVKAISLKRTASSLDSYHDCEEQCMYCLKMFAISELVEHASTCATLNKPATEELEQCCYCLRTFPLSELIDHAQNCDQRTVSSSQEDSQNDVAANSPSSSKDQLERCMYCFKDFPVSKLIHHSQRCDGDMSGPRERFQGFLPSVHDLSAISSVAILNDTQRAALQYVISRSARDSKKVYDGLLKRVMRLGYSENDLTRTLQWVRSAAPIIIHINLDKVLRFLVKDTHYRNQFETGTSGGSTDLVARRSWEDRIFNSSYKHSNPAERVKYGVLNIVGDPRGVRSCIHYGDSFLQLKKVRLRTTFASMDTSGAAVKLSCCEHYGNVLHAYTDPEITAIMDVATGKVPFHRSDCISQYKEVQIHGPVSLSENVECIVVNARHQGDARMTSLLDRFVEQNQCNLIWMDPHDLAGAAPLAFGALGRYATVGSLSVSSVRRPRSTGPTKSKRPKR